jgi:hypothetical protein
LPFDVSPEIPHDRHRLVVSHAKGIRQAALETRLH